MKDSFRLELKALISKNKLDQFFEEIRNHLKLTSPFFNDFCLLERNFKSVIDEDLQSLITRMDAEVSINRIIKSCLTKIDDIQESDLKWSSKYNTLRTEILEEKTVKLKEAEIKVLFEYIDDLEQRVDSDYELFEVFETHERYKNSMALIETRNSAKRLFDFNFMNYHQRADQFKIDYVGLVNLEVNRRTSIIKLLREQTDLIFDETKNVDDYQYRIANYSKLINDVNRLIEENLNQQTD